MKRSRKIFSLFFVTFWSGISGKEGEVELFYNEDCPVPDLADLCQNSCSRDLPNCLIGCGIDEGTGLLKKSYFHGLYKNVIDKRKPEKVCQSQCIRDVNSCINECPCFAYCFDGCEDCSSPVCDNPCSDPDSSVEAQ